MFGGAYAGKRVLVTGHTGFKGSWLSQWLLRLGAKVAGYSLYIPSQPSNFEVLHLADRIEHCEGDIRNLEGLLQVFQDFQPEIVFHLAAQPIVRSSYDEPKLTFDTNLGGTVNVLEAIRMTPSVKAAVFITSDKCYENVEWEYGYREPDRLGGKDPYSASKACAEIAFSAYWRSFFHSGDMRMATTRAGNVIGGGDWAKDRIVPDCIRAWADETVPMIRNPVSTRPWQHVLEPLGGYLWLGAKLYGGNEPGLAGEAFNFGPQAEVNQPVSKLVDEMVKTWHGSRWENGAGSIAGNPEAGLLKLCCDKVLHRLDWSACLSFEENVKMTAEWYFEYYAGQKDMVKFTEHQIDIYENLAAQRAMAWTAS
ncbi:MAG: CDP-glucose 4,6-dehydratase [Sulfuricella sp.]|nr:CDP-glucose 4,6-dehydratase [Sulfuricella sp.]